MIRSSIWLAGIWLVGTWLTGCPHLFSACTVSANEFQVRVVDAETKRPISVRMSIRNARGAAIKQRGVPYHAGHFCFFGSHNFKLPRGVYSYTIEKGLEYRTVSGQFEIKRGANDGVTVSVPRFTNLFDRGWWPGDLAIQRRLADVPVLLDANELSFANLIAETNSGLNIKEGFPGQPFKQINERMAFAQTGIVDSRLGGGLIWLGSKKRIQLPPSPCIDPLAVSREDESALAFLDHASAWDLPHLLAESDQAPEKKLNGIVIAGESLTSKLSKKRRTDLRPYPKDFPGDHQLPRWQQTIYFHTLNCGFKIPPVACSSSGNSLNPVGYNRVYVHTGQKFSREKWVENLGLGRVVVTNGPVMNVLYNGVLPGETFVVDRGKSIEIEPTLTLSLKEKAEYLEIIRNGFVAEKISLDDYAKARGKLPKIKFSESGWMTIRVATANKDAYRFALAGPIYVQVGSQPILKKTSAQFFLDWVLERGKMLKASSAEGKDEALAKWRRTYDFWKEKVAKSQ